MIQTQGRDRTSDYGRHVGRGEEDVGDFVQGFQARWRWMAKPVTIYTQKAIVEQTHTPSILSRVWWVGERTTGY